MDNKINEIRRKISTLRAEMSLVEASIRDQVNRDLDCSGASYRLMAMRAEVAELVGRWKHIADRTGTVVYEGPDADDVPALMEALAASLHTGQGNDPVVRSAMAHLNLVMIHPVRDGNGRMVRALATLVLTRSDMRTTPPPLHSPDNTPPARVGSQRKRQ